MNLPDSDITLYPDGGQDGWIFSTRGGTAPNEIERSQGSNPTFTRDYLGNEFVAGNQDLFLGFNPSLARDKLAIWVTWNADGTYTVVSPAESDNRNNPAFVQKTLLELSQLANITSLANPDGDMPEVKYQIAMKLRELAEFVTQQNITFGNGAEVVIERPFDQAAGLFIKGKETADGPFGQDIKIEANTGVARWIDRFGSFRTEATGIIFSYARAFFDGILRAYEVYIIAQDELINTDFVTTSNAYGPLGAYKQNRISWANLFKQFTDQIRTAFVGQLVSRTLSVTTLPAATSTPSVFAVAQANSATGENDIRFAGAAQVADGLMAEIILRLPSGAGGATAHQGVFLGCIEETVPADTDKDFIISSAMIGAVQAHNLQRAGATIWPTLLGTDNRDATGYMSVSFPDADHYLITADSTDTTDFTGKLNLRAILS